MGLMSVERAGVQQFCEVKHRRKDHDSLPAHPTLLSAPVSCVLKSKVLENISGTLLSSKSKSWLTEMT